MPWPSAIALMRTGWGEPWLAASSSMATQAYSALAETLMSDAAASLVLDDVQAALFLRQARPAAGPLVFALGDRPGAGPAADARVALVVQRVIGHVMLQDEVPHVALGPA